MLQQVTAEVQPRLAAPVSSAISLDRTRWWKSHYLITSYSALLDTGQSAFHTPVVEDVAGPRDICQSVLTVRFPSGVLQQLLECVPQSLPDITYYCEQRLGSKASGFRKKCHERSATSLHLLNETDGIVAAASCSSKLCLFHETLTLRLSEIRPIPCFLTEEVRVLVDPST